MSNEWFRDIAKMHTKFGFNETARKMNKKQLKELLKFRIKFLDEELDELKKAEKENDPEEVVDALIDLIVVAIGTLDIFDVDSQQAWNRVHDKNMQKERGANSTRPNKFGFPDLVKPEGWSPPEHTGNHGLLDKLNDK